MTCVQCGSTEFAKNLRTVDSNGQHGKGHLTIEAYNDPGALIFKGTKASKLRANVCTECGYVMFTVSKKDARDIGRIMNVKKEKKKTPKFKKDDKKEEKIKKNKIKKSIVKDAKKISDEEDKKN